MALRRSPSIPSQPSKTPTPSSPSSSTSETAQLQQRIDELEQRLAALEGVLTVSATGAHLKAGEVTIESQTSLKVKGGYMVTVESAGTLNVKGGSVVDVKAPLIKLN